MQQPSTVLVICTRRLGDVLLCTPLIRSIKSAWPQAQIDVLVAPGSAAALEGNPDLRAILRLGEPGLLRHIFRHYDLAVPAMISDRAHLTAFCAAPRRVVPIEPSQPGARWKKWLASSWTVFDGYARHTVTQNLALATAMGIPRQPEVVPPLPPDPQQAFERLAAAGLREKYAVLHPVPMYPYKAWTRTGWLHLIHWLHEQDFQVVLSGSGAAAERAEIREIADGSGLAAPALLDLSGTLTFAGLTPLLRGSRLYVGTDTSVTHLAAACGVPVVALTGPTNPMVWGPWPKNFAADVESPWLLRSPLQSQGTIWLVQGIKHCVPCLGEGCDKHQQSRSACLDEMPVARVIGAARDALRTISAAIGE